MCAYVELQGDSRRPKPSSGCDRTIADLFKDAEDLRRQLSQGKDQIATLQKKLLDNEQAVVVKKPSRHAAQRAAPVIQYSQRALPPNPPNSASQVVGVGMTLKQSFDNHDPGRNGQMLITDVAEGGGASESGQISPGDILVGVAPMPDLPFQTPKVRCCLFAALFVRCQACYACMHEIER